MHPLRIPPRTVLASAALLLLAGCTGVAPPKTPSSSTRPSTPNSPSRSSTTSPRKRASKSDPSSTPRAPRPSAWPRRIMAEAAPPAVRRVLEQRNPQHAAARAARACSTSTARPPPEASRRMWRAPDGTWHGFAARARILIVNTSLVPEARRAPTSIHDLADPKWKGRTGIAKPLFGTTATHAACLFASLGRRRGQGVLPRPESQRRADPRRQQAGRPGRRRRPARLRPHRHRRRHHRNRSAASPWRSSTPTRATASSARCSSPTRWPSSKAARTPTRPRKLVDYLLAARRREAARRRPQRPDPAESRGERGRCASKRRKR